MTDYSRIYKDIFYIDGSLRDIYVLGTNKHDWRVLLNFLRLEIYPLEFFVEGELRPLPGRIEDIFAQAHEYDVHLRIDEAHLALHCHFFTSKEIEFDLHPRDFHTEQQVVRLLDFIRTIGKLLNREIILTPENASTVPLFRFHPTTGKEEWFLEDRDHQE
jgi:hypothetical protein